MVKLKKVENMNSSQAQARIDVISEANFESEVLNSKQPVLVEFSAAWSRPCHVIESVLNEIAAGWAGSVRVVKVNADDNPDLSLWYEVQSIPTLLYFVDGNLRAKVVGTATKEAILGKLKAASHYGDAGSITSILDQAQS
jgi:thioredoxin 1